MNRLFLDSRGYLWLATRGGISCFNGESIKNYHFSSGLSGTKFESIVEGHNGFIYALSQQGVFRFDGVEAKKMIRFDNRYQHQHIDDNNRLWVYWQNPGTQLQGFRIFDIDQDLEDLHLSLLHDNSSIREADVIYLIDEVEGEYLTSNVQDQAEVWWYTKNTTKSISKDEALKLFLQSVAKRKGLSLPDSNHIARIVEKYKSELSKKFLINDFSPFYNEWTQNKGEKFTYLRDEKDELLQLGLKTGKLRKYKLNLEESEYRHYTDSLQHIWVGLETGFAELFSPAIIELKDPQFELIWNIIEIGQDSLLMTSFLDKAYLWVNGEVSEIAFPCVRGNIGYYMGGKQLSDGRILVPSGKGIMVLDSALRCKNSLLRQKGNESWTVQDLAINVAEELFIAACYGGVKVYCVMKDSIGLIEKINFKNDDFKDSYSNSVHIDENGRFWVGHEKGLSVFNSQENKWLHYSDLHHNFPAADVATIYQDKHDNYWFGTGQGLVFMDSLGDFRLIDDPLIYGVVNSVDSFDRNHLILGGTLGLCILDLDAWYDDGEIRGKIFNKSNGFMAGEPAENAIYRMSDSSLMIGTQSYPVQVFPDKMDLTIHPLKTRVLSVNDTLLPFTDPESSVSLPYKMDDIRIDFEAIGMYRPMQNTFYSYKLNGGEWSEWQQERFVEFNELGSGDHSFKLRAQTPGIDPTRQPVSNLAFATSVPLWQEPYFPEVLGGLLIAAILILAILAWINYYQRRRNIRYATQIDYLRIQSLQAQMNPHFVFNILGTLQNMILQSDVKRANRQLVNLSTLIRRFLESTVQGNLPEGQATIREQSLEKEIELLELYIEFEQVQHKGLFDYTIDIDPDLDTANMSLPPMLIQPFVENAIKHGLMNKEEKGHLRLSFNLENDHLHCIIKDDGVGRERAEKIRSQSMQANRSYGTDLVRERIELLNKMNYRIDCTIVDREGGGTIVTLKIGP